VKTEQSKAAAAAIVEGQQVVANLNALHDRMRRFFARVEPFEQAGRYMCALMSEVPRKNGWQIAQYIGDSTPDRTQRLLNHAIWDHDRVMGQVREFVAEQFGGEPLVVAAFDESGQEKAGHLTAGAQRQYMGCAGRIANGVNTVYCSYATHAGHGLVDARVYLPEDQLDDPERRAGLGIGDEVVFKTKPDLAIDITTSMLADDTMPGWAAADEVYGRCGKLREHFEQNNIGYVLRVRQRLLRPRPIPSPALYRPAASHRAHHGHTRRRRSHRRPSKQERAITGTAGQR
jgi:SRSO17 transposase